MSWPAPSRRNIIHQVKDLVDPRSARGLAMRLQFEALRLGSALARRLPLALVHRLATGVAGALYRVGGRRVRWTRANLRIALAGHGRAERERIARASYDNFALALVDVILMGGWSERDLIERIEVRGRENLERALTGGRGAILAGLHVGSFELGAPAAPPLLGRRVAWVSRPLANPWVDRWFSERMTRTGCSLIPPRGAARAMLRELRAGGVVGILNDQYVRRSHGIFVPFLGLRCSTSPGVALLALRTGAAVLPTYMTRLGPDRHLATVAPPIAFDRSGDRRRDVETATTALNRAYESIVRATPDQYLWSSRRFRHSPDLERSPY